MLPSQKRVLQRAFRKADKFDHFRARTRRTFVAGGVAAIAAAVGSFWVGRRTSRASPSHSGRPSPRKELARRLSAASDVELFRDRLAYLQGIEITPDDPVAWGGFRRLVTMAQESRDRELAARLLLTFKLAEPSAQVDDMAAVLQQLVD
jgi:hypothetical protein